MPGDRHWALRFSAVMPVFVDDAFREGDHWGRWQGGGHMQADSLEELHAMADRLGLMRSWLQTKPGRPWHDHYDLTSESRSLAIKLGAVPITWREAVRRNVAAREAYRALREAGDIQEDAF